LKVQIAPPSYPACSYADLKELGSENAVKAGGKYRQQGKEYVVGDGDVIYFKFNGGWVFLYLQGGWGTTQTSPPACDWAAIVC
jgi:hypothetical protein